MWDEHVDEAIDDEARRATDGLPSAGFRGRVLARIEAHDTPRSSWRAAWILTPVAAAAAILIAVVVVHERGDRTTVRLKPDTTEASRPMSDPGRVRLQPDPTDKPDATEKPDRTHKPEPTDTAAGVTVARRPAPAAPPVASGFSRTSRDADAPLPVDSIAVAPLTVDALTPAPIVIERLDAIAPIDVAPLDIPDVQRRFE